MNFTLFSIYFFLLDWWLFFSALLCLIFKNSCLISELKLWNSNLTKLYTVPSWSLNITAPAQFMDEYLRKKKHTICLSSFPNFNFQIIFFVSSTQKKSISYVKCWFKKKIYSPITFIKVASSLTLSVLSSWAGSWFF